MKKLNILFFLLLPFIDVVTALTTRLTNINLSLGIVIKSLYILVLTIYIVFYSKSKSKKVYIYYLISVVVFSLLYFITKPDLINKLYLFQEASSLFKAFYASILFFGLLVLYNDKKLDNNLIIKLLFYSLITYTMLLIIPVITHTNFDSYSKEKNNSGTIGWFYSGNDVSAIILMLYPFIYNFLNKKVDIKNKKTYLYYLLLIPVILSIFIIGTKTSWLGLIIITLIIVFIRLKKDKSIRNILLVGVILLVLGSLTLISPTTKNIKKSVINNETTTTKLDCERRWFSEVVTNKTIYKTMDSLLSGREDKAYTEILLYNESSLADRFFGIGFTDTNRINNCNVEKYIEIDILDIFVHYGIIGLILVLAPFIYTIIYIKNNIKKIDSNKIKYISIAVLMILISCIAGHIIGYPSSGIYLSLYLLLICIEKEKE